MTYFLRRWNRHERYSLAKFATDDPNHTEADVHRVGEDWEEARQKQKEANDKIRQGDPNPLGEWRSGMSAKSIEPDDE